jgi:hypothetical protein
MALRATGLSDDYISDNCEMIIISVDSASIQDVRQIALIDQRAQAYALRFAARCTLDKSAQLVRVHSCPKPLAAAAMRHGRKWTKNLRSYGRILVTKGVRRRLELVI